MKNGPTLMDNLYRMSFRNEPIHGWTNNALWRDTLRRAKKFVLDDEMSTFLGELSTQAFVRPNMSLKAKVKTIDHLRMASRLPSEVTWIEYNLRNSITRANEMLGKPPFDPFEIPVREGWLLMRHPKIDTAFQAHIVTYDPGFTSGDASWVFPIALAWTADTDTVLPWRRIPFGEGSNAPSEISTGILGYKTEQAAYTFSDMVETPNKAKPMGELLKEWSGVQRRIWAFLATITDLPVEVKEVRQSKGFVARSQYRKFLDHKTITLTVPKTRYTKVIRKALAMAHRRGGPVMSHWRRDWRNPLSPLCDHDWGADEKHIFCNVCHGRKIWINEHVRGDTSRGFVTHDYTVTHDPQGAR